MRTIKRAVIGTIAVVITLAALFFGGVGIAALVKSVPYMEILGQVWAALPFGK